jgi:uncharacterized membrane protein
VSPRKIHTKNVRMKLFANSEEAFMERILPRTNRRESESSRVWSGVAGGVLLVYGIKHGSLLGTLVSVAGADLLTHSITGHHIHETFGIKSSDWRIPHQLGVQMQRSLCVGVEPQQAYEYFRNFQNLPRFMKHLESVSILDTERSHWVVKGPAGTHVEWDARIINDQPGEMISWRSENDPGVSNAGSVQFVKAPQGRGTILRVSLQYAPPAGALGAVTAKLFGEEPELQLRADLKRLKQVLETGEITTTEGQPAGRGRGRQAARVREEEEKTADKTLQGSRDSKDSDESREQKSSLGVTA